MSIDSHTILIIEDNADIRESLRMVLELKGNQVFEAANGEEGLNFLHKMIPDIILLDLMMPVMNGWKFIEAVAQNQIFSTIPIIVLSAYADKTPTIQANAFLLKPVDINHLFDTISAIIMSEKA